MKSKLILFLVLLSMPFGMIMAQLTGEPALADQYFRDAEYDLALPVYERLHKADSENEHYIFRIGECYYQLGEYEEGIKFIGKIAKKLDDPRFKLYEAYLTAAAGDDSRAAKMYQDVIDNELISRDDFMSSGAFLNQLEKRDLALQVYERGRKVLKDKFLFSSEIANIYVRQGEPGKAVEEFLNQYYQNPGYYNGIKVQVLNLVNADTQSEIESVLLSAANEHQDDRGIRDMIYEFYVQTGNWYEAFVQVKAIDRFFKQENGHQVYKFALTLRNNKEFALSNKSLDFIIENHPSSPYYFSAYMEKTVNNEMLAFQSIPLDTQAVRAAVAAYDDLFERFGRKTSFFNAMYRKANLLAFYLHDLEGAMDELRTLIMLPIKPMERAQANLLIGDILLMQKDYQNASLKYLEVEEAYKDEQIGALAKFRTARLSYYKGDFDFANARLVSIKDNTSNDISNDAIQLYLTILDNTGLDSTTVALQRFAQAQLKVYQRSYGEAMEVLDSLLFEYPNHTLTDEILWEKANIYLQTNQTDKAIEYLDKVVNEHGSDIFGDDALYTKARIYDFTRNNKEKALELYIEFLVNYPGSLYSVEVRKRVRELRDQKL